MGLIHLGIPKDLITELSRAFGVTYFVETGTHHGWSALWASGHFEKVWTVELDEALFRRASRRLANRANVEQHLGPSVEILRSVVPLLDRPARTLRGDRAAAPPTGVFRRSAQDAARHWLGSPDAGLPGEKAPRPVRPSKRFQNGRTPRSADQP